MRRHRHRQRHPSYRREAGYEFKKSTSSAESLDFDGPVGLVFYGFGVFREVSGGPGRSGMLQDKSGRLLQMSIFDSFPKA